jgi:tol-pal system protein YbgF
MAFGTEGIRTLRTVLTTAAVVVLALAAPVSSQKKEIIQLQRDMDLLRQDQRGLQRAVDEKHAVLKTLLEQTLDQINRLSTQMGALQKGVLDVQANTGSRLDTMSTQFQALSDNLEEVKARVSKLQQQVTETQGVLQSLDAKVAGGTPVSPITAPTTSNSPPPSADVLYTSALRDFQGGKNDLARQQFLDYLKYYPETDLASNAQFYLAEILYRQRQFREAVPEYDRVLDNYPKSFKLAAARLKKALALVELGQRTSAMRELREVERRHPGTEESRAARAKLRELAPG